MGLEAAGTIAAVIATHKLFREEGLLERLSIQYQIPYKVGPGEKGHRDVGPEIRWNGPEGDLELEGLFRAEPDLLDVGFLKRGIAASTSVCRVEVCGANRGTGVLIDRNLVLTNYHVLGSTDDEVRDAARSTTFRFGAYTDESGKEGRGQVIGVDNDYPVVSVSGVGMYDFVLLRTSERISSATYVSPATFAIAKPDKNTGLNILHHPEGEAMKLTVSSNGVTSIVEEKGRVQYVARTSNGSSGSPCFNDDWKVVALHHAERARTFGVIKEGILMSQIYPVISEYLAAQPR